MTTASNPRLAGYRLVTSNPDKLLEFRRLGLSCERVDLDLREVDSDPVEVVVRKAASAGPMTIVEDTSLDVEGADVGVSVRWLMEEANAMLGRKATWRTLVAVNDGTDVSVHAGEIDGVIVRAAGPPGFGFQPYFAPDGAGGLTLAELEAAGTKDDFSARAVAVKAFLDGVPSKIVSLASLEEWRGEWQSDEAPRAP